MECLVAALKALFRLFLDSAKFFVAMTVTKIY